MCLIPHLSIHIFTTVAKISVILCNLSLFFDKNINKLLNISLLQSLETNYLSKFDFKWASLPIFLRHLLTFNCQVNNLIQKIRLQLLWSGYESINKSLFVAKRRTIFITIFNPHFSILNPWTGPLDIFPLIFQHSSRYLWNQGWTEVWIRKVNVVDKSLSDFSQLLHNKWSNITKQIG